MECASGTRAQPGALFFLRSHPSLACMGGPRLLAGGLRTAPAAKHRHAKSLERKNFAASTRSGIAIVLCGIRIARRRAKGRAGAYQPFGQSSGATGLARWPCSADHGARNQGLAFARCPPGGGCWRAHSGVCAVSMAAGSAIDGARLARRPLQPGARPAGRPPRQPHTPSHVANRPRSLICDPFLLTF